MRVVVTGSESFIGRELIAQCMSRGVEVLGMDAVPGERTQAIIDIRSPDVSDVIPEGADALVHLAAISRDADCREEPALAFDVNVGGTLNLVSAARARRIGKLVFASSEWVYGDIDDGRLQREDAPIDASRIGSEYALTKLVGERVLAMALERGGLCPVVVLRFGIVYGPRPANWSAVEALFDAVRTREVVEVRGSLRSARRFVHVSDIARGILAALTQQEEFEVFNLSGDRVVTLAEIIEESARLLGRRPSVAEGDPAAVSVRNPDNRKAREVLGWQPEVGLRDGLLTLLQTVMR